MLPYDIIVFDFRWLIQFLNDKETENFALTTDCKWQIKVYQKAKKRRKRFCLVSIKGLEDDKHRYLIACWEVKVVVQRPQPVVI